MVRKVQRILGLTLMCCALMLSSASAQLTSPSYRVEETQFGTGGELDASSSSYKAQQSAGALGAGNTSSSSYDAIAGYPTPSEPFIEFVVTGATVSFGTLSDSSTSSGAAQAGACNCSFYVRSYLSSDYSIVTASAPPQNEHGDTLQAKTTLGVPSTNVDVEEFGMNLVDNTSPNIGANPVNQPDNTFADGKAATGYDTVDQFKYGIGDTIARSPATVGNQGVGQTDYTISYIAKASRQSKAGFYSMDHVLIVVPTF